MARGTRKVEVAIVGDASSMVRAFRTADNAAGRFGKGGSKLGAIGMGLLAGGAAGATVAIGQGLVAAVRTGIDEFQEQAKVSAQTAAAIKSTGGAAGVTQGHIEALASSLQEQTGLQDDAIQSAQNLLLTFTDISNRGPDKVFDRATRAAMDLSVAFHKDLNGSAVLVGKALNDPIKGLSALGRVGVQFTAGQKETIKALVETGQKAKAQKMILGELEKQVGGSAKAYGETTPGQIAKAQRAWEDLTQGMVAAIVPLAATVLPYLTAGIRSVIDFFQQNWPKMQQVAQQVWAWFSANLLPGLRELWAGISSIVVSIVGVFRQYWPQIWGVVGPAMNQIVNTIRTALNIVSGVIKVFAALLRGDWSGVWDGVKQIVSSAVMGILNTLRNLGSSLLGVMRLAGLAIWNGLKTGAAAVAQFPGWLLGKVVDGVQSVAAEAGSAWKAVGTAIWTAIKSGAAAIARLGSWILGKLKAAAEELAGKVQAAFSAIGQAIVEGIKSGMEALWPGFLGWLADKFDLLPEWAKKLLGVGSPSKVFANEVGAPIVQGIMVGMEREQGALQQVTKAVVGKATRAAFEQLRASAASGVAGLSSMFQQYKTSTYSNQSGFSRGNDTFSDAGTGFAAGLSLNGKRKAMADRQALRQENALKADIERLNADEFATESDRQAARDALQDFYAQREIDRQQEAVDAAAAGDAEAVKSLAERFRTGEIDANTFNTAINELLGGDAGAAMGTMFGTDWVQAFREAMAPVQEIIRNALGSQTGPSTPDTGLSDAVQVDQGAAWVREARRLNTAKPATTAKQWKAFFDAHGTNMNEAHGFEFAKGGIVTAPVRGLVGEAGREAIIPLDGARARKMLNAAGVGGGGATINLTLNGVVNAKDAARLLRPELDRLVRVAI